MLDCFLFFSLKGSEYREELVCYAKKHKLCELALELFDEQDDEFKVRYFIFVVFAYLPSFLTERFSWMFILQKLVGIANNCC